jgi:hypothetical protein
MFGFLKKKYRVTCLNGHKRLQRKSPHRDESCPKCGIIGGQVEYE